MTTHQAADQETGLGSTYRRFWLSQTVSFVGSQVTVFALPIIVALSLHSSAGQVGILVAVQQLPNVIAGPLLGPLVDRAGKHALLFRLDILRAILVAVVPGLFLLHWLSFDVIAIIACVLGVATVAFEIAYVAYVPMLVPDALLGSANSKLEGSYSAAQVAGPGLGAVLVTLLGAPLSLFADMLSFVFSAAMLATIKGRVAEPKAEVKLDAADSGYLRNVGVGIRVIWDDPGLRLLGLGSGIFNLFSGAASTVVVLFAVRELGVPPGWYGTALAVGACGGVIGAATITRIEGRYGNSFVLSIGLFLAGAAQIIVVWLRHGHTLVNVTVFATSELIVGFGATLFIIASLTIRQRIIPSHMIGAVYGSMRLFTRGAIPFGALLAGLAGEALDFRWVVLAAAIGQAATGLVFSSFRRLLVVKRS